MRSGISLDFYNTLVEIDRDVPTIGAALTARGFPCSPAVEAIWNSSGFDGQATCDPEGGGYDAWRSHAIRQLVALCGAPPSVAASMADELLALDRKWTVRARDGASALLQAIKDMNLACCILTNWDYPIAPYLEMAGLDPAIPAITSAELGFRKPNVEAFERARRLMGVDAGHHIHIGDDWMADVAGAIRSGARAIWITDTPPADPLPAAIMASRVTDVPNLLAKVVGRREG
jgi:FMN phosphatase YigB (HAD superfamily)